MGKEEMGKIGSQNQIRALSHCTTPAVIKRVREVMSLLGVTMSVLSNFTMFWASVRTHNPLFSFHIYGPVFTLTVHVLCWPLTLMCLCS